MSEKLGSGNVVVFVYGVFNSLEVLFVDELLDHLLDETVIGDKVSQGLPYHFFDKSLVVQLLSSLHRSHDDSLQEHLPIFCNGVQCSFGFLDRVYILDAKLTEHAGD